ncbi:hypothetical protein CY34DRAFT_101229 [Suillus luteus UH-Slu-Lm8-n1]|uniref:WD40 repeat-like protein n=1 Tax=Suillus luteus UH-Slu-Lm8-n1 TaxID=930992 RepID=A0A0D0AEB4_9AGAM|nr:hypothetical protein CY34DRAFT_101229 [Suillus luteus UH-Slu-Lm8-n1]
MASPTTKTKETSAITPRQKFEGHTEWVWSIIHLPDGQRVMTGSYDGSLRMWDVKSGKQIGNDWRDGESKVYGIALSPDGKKVVSASEDGAVRLWDIDTCKIITKWMGHKDTVKPVCWSPDGRRVLSGSEDGTARQWDVELEKGESIIASKFEGHTDSVIGAIHLPGGQRIITCSVDDSLRVWNVKSGKQIGDDWKDSGVRSIALSPDGKKVVSGGVDGAVRLWDIETCKVIKKWTGHTNGVGSVCWSRDGQRVLSGSNDGTARQWDVDSGETILEPVEIIPASIETGHETVLAVVYSPDTTFIATGGRDSLDTGESIEHSVKIWDAKTGKLVAALKGQTDIVWHGAWLGPRPEKRSSPGHMIRLLGYGIQPTGSKPRFWINTPTLSLP